MWLAKLQNDENFDNLPAVWQEENTENLDS